MERFKTDRNGSARTLSDEQLADIFNELENPYRLIAQICYYCAARVGEVTLLHGSDIDLGARAIVFRAKNTKKDATRTAAICDELHEALEAYGIPQDGYLFPSPRSCGRKRADGTQRETISRQSVDKELQAIFTMLDVKGAATHSFRRSMATNLAREGCTLAEVAEITGHRDLSSLSYYIDPEAGKAQSKLAAIAKRSKVG
jgi:integrase/recombinase XerD